ncbi:MAG: GNAT family N-acetyltransferase [Phycisphaerae bacterium]
MIETPDSSGPKDACTIRQAGPTDIDIIARFNAAMATETEGRDLDLPLLRSGAKAVLEDPVRGLYFLAEVDGRVVAQTMITYEWSDWHSGWYWWIQSVYVDPDHRRKGVFRAIHRHIARAARAEPDVCGLRLYVDQRNQAARSTYPRLGINPTQYLVYEEDWSATVGH